MLVPSDESQFRMKRDCRLLFLPADKTSACKKSGAFF
jgi:hypothetical protein